MENQVGFVEGRELDWEDLGNGLKRKILGFDEKMMMTHMIFRKGGVGALHKHPHTQVTFIERGSFEVQIGKEKKVLRAGDSFLVPSNTEHGVVALEDSSLIDVFAPMREDFLKG